MKNQYHRTVTFARSTVMVRSFFINKKVCLQNLASLKQNPEIQSMRWMEAILRFQEKKRPTKEPNLVRPFEN